MRLKYIALFSLVFVTVTPVRGADVVSKKASIVARNIQKKASRFANRAYKFKEDHPKIISNSKWV